MKRPPREGRAVNGRCEATGDTAGGGGGEGAGEAVTADNDIWYQLEDGTFVYSGAV